MDEGERQCRSQLTRSLEAVNDASRMAALIVAGAFAADDVLAVIGKTEGNGGVNDFTRILADQAFDRPARARHRGTEQVEQVPMVWSGGTDGVLCPHATVFARILDDGDVTGDEPRWRSASP